MNNQAGWEGTRQWVAVGRELIAALRKTVVLLQKSKLTLESSIEDVPEMFRNTQQLQSEVSCL